VTAMLEVEALHVTFAGAVCALRGVSLSLQAGGSLAVVGESGAGKTTLARSLVGLLQAPEAAGSVRIAGRELLGASAVDLRSLRWRTVAIAPQGLPFNPVATIGDQIAEPLRLRAGMDAGASAQRVEALADEVLLDPALLERFPHELSGGERRHAMLAMVLALDPQLVILDEPTAGLDPLTRRAMLDRIALLRRERGFALVLVTHDLPAAAALAEACVVLYAGEIVESASAAAVVGAPLHPYTTALVRALPLWTTTKDLRPIRGTAPDPWAVPGGCAFHPRCTQAKAICRDEHPALGAAQERLVACHLGGLQTLLSAAGVSKSYAAGRRSVQVLDDVGIEVREGESVGVVGPTGSGKTTLARILTGQLTPDAGEVLLEGRALSGSWRGEARRRRRRMQLIMQDPWDALSPRLTVQELVAEPLDVEDRRGDRCAVAEALVAVGLPASGAFVQARAHELSGGELQRINLARALVAQPKLLVADEPTSMLDASEQARLMTLLRELQVELGLGLILISHDLALVRKVADRIVLLEDGRVAESGSSEAVTNGPRSTIGRRLVDAARTPPP